MKTLLVVLALLAVPSMAAAQTAKAKPDTKGEASARFDRGVRLFDEKDFAGAIAEFKLAHQIAPHPSVLYNLALAYAAGGRPVDAADTLAKILEEPLSLAPVQVARAREMYAEQSARIAEIVVATTSTGARIEIDNIEAGVAPLAGPLRVSSGTHIVGAVLAGHVPARKQITVAGRSRVEVALELVAMDGRLAHLLVRTNLPGADLVANGEVIATTPIGASLTLAPGAYRLELRRRGYFPARSALVLGEGASGVVELEPEEDPSQRGGLLEVRASEPSSAVTIDGKLRGVVTGPIKVPAGPHRLRVEHVGFFPSERDVVVPEDGHFAFDAHLQPTPPTRAAYESSVRTRLTWGWIALGGGAALAAGSAGYLIYNAGKVEDALTSYDQIVFDSERGSGRRCDPRRPINQAACIAEFDDASSTLDASKARNVAGFITLGVGLAAAATGAVLLLGAGDLHKYDRAPASRAGASSPGLTLSGGWEPGGGRAAVNGTF